MENKRTAAGYIRVESRETGWNDITFQKEAIEEFSNSIGMGLLDMYIDNADESVNLDKRDGYLRLNKDILSGKINTVVTYSFDRFTRDDREKLGLLNNFAEKGVEMYIASTGEYINPSDPITREQRLLAEAMRDTEQIRADIVRDRRRHDQ